MADETHKVVESWLKILESVKTGAPITPLAADFDVLARFISDRTPVVAVEILEVARRLATKDAAPAPSGAVKIVKRFPRVVWDIHENESGRKVRWSCRWQNMALRVDHARDAAGKVVFLGSINGERVAEGKILAQVQAAVAARALERAQAKAK